MARKRQDGSPQKPAANRKRNNLTFRTRGDLRDRLEKAAAQSGRSISEEIEHRLTMTFLEDQSFLITRIALDNEQLRATNAKLEHRLRHEKATA